MSTIELRAAASVPVEVDTVQVRRHHIRQLVDLEATELHSMDMAHQDQFQASLELLRSHRLMFLTQPQVSCVKFRRAAEADCIFRFLLQFTIAKLELGRSKLQL